MSDAKDFYDFRDWSPFGDDVVRQNLVEAFRLARDGYWWVGMADSDDDFISSDHLEWQCKLDEAHDYAPLVTIDPAQWRAAMFEELRLRADDGDRDALRRSWHAMTGGWREALDSVDAKAKEWLDQWLRHD